LYDIYYEYKNAKELHNALEEEYNLDDAGIGWFISSSFNKFMMVDSKPNIDQIHEFQVYIRHLQSKRNQFSNDYKVSYLINKLFPSWSNFAGDLRHKQEDLTLIQAFKAIRIEDQHRLNSKTKNEMKAKMNLVEDKPKRKFKNPKRKKLTKPYQSQSSHFKPKTFSHKSNGIFCYICGRTNHLAPECFYWKKESFKLAAKGNGGNFGHKVNMVEQIPINFRLVTSILLSILSYSPQNGG